MSRRAGRGGGSRSRLISHLRRARAGKAQAHDACGVKKFDSGWQLWGGVDPSAEAAGLKMILEAFRSDPRPVVGPDEKRPALTSRQGHRSGTSAALSGAVASM